MSKHTPGPWVEWSNCIYGGTITKILPWTIEGGTKVVDLIDELDLETEEQAEEAKANKALILAAPDLLAACKVAMVMLQVVGADHMAGVRQIEAAIEKANKVTK